MGVGGSIVMRESVCVVVLCFLISQSMYMHLIVCVYVELEFGV